MKRKFIRDWDQFVDSSSEILAENLHRVNYNINSQIIYFKNYHFKILFFLFIVESYFKVP